MDKNKSTLWPDSSFRVFVATRRKRIAANERVCNTLAVYLTQATRKGYQGAEKLRAHTLSSLPA
jgi:hypothetical protein